VIARKWLSDDAHVIFRCQEIGYSCSKDGLVHGHDNIHHLPAPIGSDLTQGAGQLAPVIGTSGQFMVSSRRLANEFKAIKFGPLTRPLSYPGAKEKGTGQKTSTL